MKMKFFKYIPIMLGLALAITSCADDEDGDLNSNPTVPKPSIDISVNGDVNLDVYEVMKGSSISFGLTANKAANGGEKLDLISLSQTGLNAKPTIQMTSKEGKDYTFVGDAELNIKNADNDQLIFTETLTGITDKTGITTYEFTVKDKEGLSNTATFDIDVITATPFNDSLTGEIWHIKGTKKGSWSLTADSAIGVSNADSDADITNTNDAGVTFNGAFEVGANRANTSFVKAGAAFDYSTATVETATAAFQAGTPSTSESAPQVGDVYIYNLNGDYAVVKVTVVDPTASCGPSCANPGKMEFVYKK